MNTPECNPLTDDHCAQLDAVLKSVPMHLELAKACQDCGLDTSGYIDQLNAQREMAQKLKAKFFPTRP